MKMISCHVVHLKRQTVKRISCHVVIFQSFVKRIMAHLNTWIGNTMVGGQVQVNLIGNAGVTGRLWTLVSRCCVVFLFFFLRFGRSRSKARSLHEKKL